jgi:prepilin-type N-terminal cleavage/methylation domain-containing protein
MQSNKRGFTLIELLVVIAIIAVLAGILFPVFAMVRAKARIAADFSNLHQIGVGYARYVADNAGNAPPFLWGTADGTNYYCSIDPSGSYVAPNDQKTRTDPTRKFSYQEDGFGNTLYNYLGLLANGTAAGPADYYDYLTGTGTQAGNAPTLPPPPAGWTSAGIKKPTDFPMLRNRSNPKYTIVTWSPYQRRDAGDGGTPYDTGTISILRQDGSAKTYANDRGSAWSVPNANGLTPFQYQTER